MDLQLNNYICTQGLNKRVKQLGMEKIIIG
jgi:hypothetical protein